MYQCISTLICIFLFTVVNENVSLVISRQLLADFCSHLSKLDDEIAMQVAHYTLDKVHTRVISFEEQVSTKLCKEILYEVFQIVLNPEGQSHCDGEL